MKALEKRIAGRLLATGALSESELESALKDYKGDPPLRAYLVDRGFVTPAQACRAEAEVNGLQFVELDEMPSAPEALALFTAPQAWAEQIVPIWFEPGAATIAIADPNDVIALDSLRLRLKAAVVVLVAERGDLQRALARYYGPNPLERPAKKPLTPEDSEFERAATVANEAPMRDVNNTHTQLDIPKLDLKPSGGAEPPRKQSSSGEISHRDFQRKMREMRESGDEPAGGISQAQTQFLASSEETIERVETGRRERGAWEPPRNSAMVEKLGAEVDSPAVSELRALLDQAVEVSAEELELVPAEGALRARFRIDGQWHRTNGYDLFHHQQVVGRLRLMAGLELKPRDIASDHQFLLPTKRGQRLCTLHLEETIEGPRAVVRFTENRLLLDDPTMALGLPPELAEDVLRRLSGKGGGLLFLTATTERTLHHLYYSLFRNLATKSQRDFLSLERAHERRIPGVTAINCPTEDILLASLANASFMNPDVLGVMSVENGTVLRQLINVSMRGTTVIAGLTAPTSAVAHECFRAATVDPMNLLRGVIGHLHVEDAPKLCSDCARPIAERESLPAWAREMEVPFHEAVGCEACSKTGYRGMNYLAEFYRPDVDSMNGGFVAAVPRDRDLLAFALAAELDPREYAPPILQ